MKAHDTISQEGWRQACYLVISAARTAKPHAGIHYAATYARAGLDMTGHERSVQALYILSNLSGWRGPVARATKDILKTVSKEA